MSLGAQDSAKATGHGGEDDAAVDATTADAASAADASPGGAAATTPFFEVTRGNPTAEEVGILAAVFATAEGNAAHADENDRSIKNDWGAFEDRLRPPFGYNPNSFLNRRQF